MDLSNFTTLKNLEAAFGGESMANRKYLFFANVARKLGFTDLAKLFKETADQETEHAFAHFELLHPELVVKDAASLTDEQKREIMSRCLSLAIEGETYEYTEMYPSFRKAAVAEGNTAAIQEIDEQISESKEHAEQFQAMLAKAAKRFAALANVEERHANHYKQALAKARELVTHE